MAFKNSSTAYGTFSKLLHWGMALIILTLIAVGIYMADLPKDTPEQKDYAFQFYGLHKSFGVIVLLLIVVRLVWLRLSPAPELPAVFEGKERLLVTGLQKLLYLLMLLAPLSGYLMSNSAGFPVQVFGLFEMPALVEKSEALNGFLHEAHELLGFGILLLVILHAAGAIKHRLKDKGGESDILGRML